MTDRDDDLDETPAGEWCAEHNEEFGDHDHDAWIPYEQIRREWREPATTYLDEPLPQPGRVIVADSLASASASGYQFARQVGTVLWADASHRIVETTTIGGPVGSAPRVERRTAAQACRIQLDDGRTVQLDSTTPGRDRWHYQSAEEAEGAAALVAAADALDVQAGTVDDPRAASALREQARALRETTGAPRPRRDPAPPGAQELGPRKPSWSELLEQDQVWWPARGGPVALADMGPRHKRNLLALLERKAPWLWDRWTRQFTGAPDEVFDEVMRTKPEQWITEQPLVVKLVELIAADRAAGVPDEAPPTREQLIDYWERTGDHRRLADVERSVADALADVDRGVTGD